MANIPAERFDVYGPLEIMKAANTLQYALYGFLYGISAILLTIENYAVSWLWLLIFFSLSLVTVLTFFLSKEQPIWHYTLTFLHGALLLLLACLTKGFGCIPLAIPLQMNIAMKYGRKAFMLLSAGLYTSLILAFYYMHGLVSAYPAVFMVLSGLVMVLLLLWLKDSALLQQMGLEKIAELQVSKKVLRDLNLQMKRYDEEMEKMTILRERNQMSKRMHDTLGHVLTAVSVQLEAAELLMEKDPKEALVKIANAKAQAKEGLTGIKQALSMIDEDHIQFEDRLHDVIAKAEAGMGTKTLAQIHVKGGLIASMQEFLLSALREGITNGVRHGGATAFVFRLTAQSSQVLFYLEDNGKGCGNIAMGYGLTAMEKQAEAFGGTLECHSAKDEGFVLSIAIPSGRNEP